MNCLSQPQFDKEQISKCQNCKYISAKKLWCSKWGVWVREEGNIIQPKKRIIKPPTIVDMMNHFSRAMVKWGKKGFKTVKKDEYLRRRGLCNQCTPTGRCPHCGCSLWAKAALVTEHCPEGKW